MHIREKSIIGINYMPKYAVSKLFRNSFETGRSNNNDVVDMLDSKFFLTALIKS